MRSCCSSSRLSVIVCLYRFSCFKSILDNFCAWKSSFWPVSLIYLLCAHAVVCTSDIADIEHSPPVSRCSGSSFTMPGMTPIISGTIKLSHMQGLHSRYLRRIAELSGEKKPSVVLPRGHDGLTSCGSRRQDRHLPPVLQSFTDHIPSPARETIRCKASSCSNTPVSLACGFPTASRQFLQMLSDVFRRHRNAYAHENFFADAKSL